MYKATMAELIFCMFFWAVTMFIYLPALKSTGRGIVSRYPKSNSRLFVLFCLITLYSVFEFAGGDFYHYKEFYEVMHIRGERDGLDPIYLWLADTLPASFYLWRLAIWGAAAFIWTRIIKRLGCSVSLAGCMFFLVVFFLFVGARQALGFSLLYLGVTMMSDPHARRDRLFGLLIFLSAYFFHSTMIVYMLMALFVCLPLGKRFIVLSLVLFPVAYHVFDILVDTFLVQINLLNEASARTIERYLESDFRAEANVKGLIRLIIDRLPIIVLLFIAMKDVFWKNLEIGVVYRKFLLLSYAMIYVSCLFVGRDVSSFISPRFWDAALFPFTLFLCGYFTEVKARNIAYLCLLLLAVSKIYTYLYAFYKL